MNEINNLITQDLLEIKDHIIYKSLIESNKDLHNRLKNLENQIQSHENIDYGNKNMTLSATTNTTEGTSTMISAIFVYCCFLPFLSHFLALMASVLLTLNHTLNCSWRWSY